MSNGIIVKQWEYLSNGLHQKCSDYWVAYTEDSWIDVDGEPQYRTKDRIFHKTKEDAELAVCTYLLRSNGETRPIPERV